MWAACDMLEFVLVSKVLHLLQGVLRTVVTARMPCHNKMALRVRMTLADHEVVVVRVMTSK